MLTDAKPPFEARAMLDRLYAGEILCFSALPAMQALVALAREHCERALAVIAGDPTQVHAALAPAEQVEHLARLRRDYAQDVAVRARWRELFESIGMQAEQVARDRLLLRFQTHHLDDATRAGNIHTDPFDLHRDTWGSNLYAQINWWAPGWFRRISDGKRLSELLDLEPLCPFAGQPEGSNARGQGQEIVSR